MNRLLQMKPTRQELRGVVHSSPTEPSGLASGRETSGRGRLGRGTLVRWTSGRGTLGRGTLERQTSGRRTTARLMTGTTSPSCCCSTLTSEMFPAVTVSRRVGIPGRGFCDVTSSNNFSQLMEGVSGVRGRGRGSRVFSRVVGAGGGILAHLLASTQVAQLADRLPWYQHRQPMYLQCLPRQSSEVLCHYPHRHPHPLPPPASHFATSHLPPLHLRHLHRPFRYPHRCPTKHSPVRPNQSSMHISTSGSSSERYCRPTPWSWEIRRRKLKRRAMLLAVNIPALVSRPYSSLPLTFASVTAKEWHRRYHLPLGFV
jgi:hypothetical protein